MNVDTRPSIRSAWPTPIGKPLTNRMITKYAKKGYYVTNNPVARAEKRSKTAEKKVSKTLSDLI